MRLSAPRTGGSTRVGGGPSSPPAGHHHRSPGTTPTPAGNDGTLTRYGTTRDLGVDTAPTYTKHPTKRSDPRATHC